VREETAFEMSRPVRLAALIVFGQHDGGEWEWDSMRWKERNSR
jgi:hypothetical protein